MKPIAETVEKVLTETKKKLTRKQKKFVDEYVKGKTGTQAAKEAYNVEDDNTAAVIASENLRKPQIEQALADAFPDDLLQQKHHELLNAGKLDQMTFPLERRKVSSISDDVEGEELYKDAIALLAEEEKVSTSWVQRKLKIGYARAARIMDMFKDDELIDENGIVDQDAVINFDDVKEATFTEKLKEYEESNFSNQDIRDLLASVGCVVKRIVPMYGLRHVYFWSPDNLARDKALDKAYKVKGSYAAEKIAGPNGEPLFTNEHKNKSKRAVAGYIAGRNTGQRG